MILEGDAETELRGLAPESVQACVTSPPYWRQRDYGHPEQLGLEEHVEEYVERVVRIFREVRRVLREDGTLWLNLGDTYARGAGGAQGRTGQMFGRKAAGEGVRLTGAVDAGHGRKQLVGVPWRVAFALQADGWLLRQDIVWEKPNPMPESVQDRCTRGHEYVFLLAKSDRYAFYPDAIAEESTRRHSGTRPVQRDDNNHRLRTVLHKYQPTETRRARSVWPIASNPTSHGHIAPMPRQLARRCVLASTQEGDTVLDPFLGSGTVALEASRLGRQYVGVELKPEYVQLARAALAQKPIDFFFSPQDDPP